MLRELVGMDPDLGPGFVLLPDPFTCRAEAVVGALGQAYPGSVVVGGLASGGSGPGENALLIDDTVFRDGAVGVALAGDVVIETVVPQGCRPIGDPMRVTRSRDNLVLELDGEPALGALDLLFNGLGRADRIKFQRSPMLGIAMNPEAQRFRAGDFLIRHVVGIDRPLSAVAVGHALADGAVVQFHVRDADASAEDLTELLARYARQHGAPAGALLFSCLGRGEHLYRERDHDSRLVHEHLGEVPLGGFFCNGEIGPVHGRGFLHGYTAAFGMFRAREWS